MKAFTINALRLNLKARSKALGSERKLAEQLGVSYSYMNDIVRGKRRPGRKVLSALGLREERMYISKRC
jgi:transcriptional regulator with XRE-family HTH domain